MTRKDVKEVVYECLTDWNNRIVAIKPRMTTAEVAAFLQRSRSYVLQNKNRFGPIRVDRRGKIEYDTKKVIEYLKLEK